MKHLFFRLTKADESRREVSGIMVSETPDKMDEVFDYETSKPYFRAWSDEINKATDGKSLGNVREMHQPVAVGKVTALDFDDDAKKIAITAKVYQDSTWEKVSLGILTGFSIGGSYEKKWDDNGLTRYTARPAEVSLVDNPAVPDAHFTLVHADGSSELVKAVGAMPTQMWNCGKGVQDAHAHSSKAAAAKCMKDAGDGDGDDDMANAAKALVPTTDADEHPDTVTCPGCGAECAMDAKYCSRCGASLAGAGDTAIPQSTETVAAATQETDLGDVHAAKAAAPEQKGEDPMAKKEDEKPVEVPVEKAADAPKPEEKPAEIVAKADGPSDLEKGVAAGIEKAMGPVTEKIASLEKALASTIELVGKVVEKVASLPAPAKGVLRVVKGNDATEDGTGADVKKADTPEEERHDLFKQAFRSGKQF